MKRIEEIEARRKEILKEMGQIKSMKRGTLTEQYLKVRHRGKKEPVLRGPYYVLSRHAGGGTVSRRVSLKELSKVRRELEEAKRFRELCREFEELTEELGLLVGRADEDGREKKRLNSRLRRTSR